MRESVACGCRRGDVVARDDVIECKSLRYTVIEHFSHFPSRASVTSLARSLARSLVRATVLSRRIKIEANIVAVVLPSTRPRVERTHIRAIRCTLRGLSEAADKYRSVSRGCLRLKLRANASARLPDVREKIKFGQG